MGDKISVIHEDGTSDPEGTLLIEKLEQEAKRGTIQVKLYRGPERCGAEAFYTLSDGTVLHEVTGTTDDGQEYRYLVRMKDGGAPRPGLFRRFGKSLREAMMHQ